MTQSPFTPSSRALTAGSPEAIVQPSLESVLIQYAGSALWKILTQAIFMES